MTNCIPVFPVFIPFIFLLAYCIIIDILGQMMKRETFLKQPKHSNDNFLTFSWMAATSHRRLQITIYCFSFSQIKSLTFKKALEKYDIQFLYNSKKFFGIRLIHQVLLYIAFGAWAKKGTGNKVNRKPHAHYIFKEWNKGKKMKSLSLYKETGFTSFKKVKAGIYCIIFRNTSVPFTRIKWQVCTQEHPKC